MSTAYSKGVPNPASDPMFYEGAAQEVLGRQPNTPLVSSFIQRFMGFDQYHEPADELSDATRTFARMITSLTEEAEAIGWYEQRISLEKNRQAKAIMQNAQLEEMKHFGMDLEFLLRTKRKWRDILKEILFTTGDIVKHGENAEEAADLK